MLYINLLDAGVSGVQNGAGAGSHGLELGCDDESDSEDGDVDTHMMYVPCGGN